MDQFRLPLYIYVYIYVDDILPIGDHKEHLDGVADKIASTFEILAKARVSKFLGVMYDFMDIGDVHLYSSAAIERILCQFNSENCRPISTPIPASTVLTSI